MSQRLDTISAYFYYFLPPLLITLFVGLVILGPDLSHLDLALIVFLLGNIVFLNATHTLTTFVMYMMLPELREWRTSMLEKGEDLDRKLGLIWVSLLIFFMSYFFLLTVLESTLTKFLMLAGLKVGPLYHGCRQLQGLQSQFLHEVGTPGEIGRSRWIIGSFVFSIFLLGVWSYLGINAKELESGVPAWVLVLGLALLLLTFWALSLSKNTVRKFLAVDIRILANYLPLWGSTFHVIGTSQHGTEYWYIFRHMVRKSKASEEVKESCRKWNLILGLLSVPFFIAMFFSFKGIVVKDQFSSMGLLVLGSTYALIYLHYYLDGRMFRFRDEITRKKVSPLLADVFSPEKLKFPWEKPGGGLFK
jgi:hypothetical protein